MNGVTNEEFRMHKVNLGETFNQFDGYFQPKIVGELNGQHVKLVKAKGSSPGTPTSMRTRCFSSSRESWS
jgi:hypothetical protein